MEWNWECRVSPAAIAEKTEGETELLRKSERQKLMREGRQFSSFPMTA